MFGGIDSSKYTGTLYTVPLVNIYEGFSNPIALDITLQGMGVSTDDSSKTITTSQIPVLLDSGTTLTYFPSQYIQMVADAIGATYVSSGLYGMNCPSQDDDRQLVFDFGGFHIKAPLSSFLITSNGNSNVCFLGMVSQDKLPAILGDLFLTHAYIVYDLDNFEVSMAQADYTGSDENIEAIIDGVPGAVKASGYDNKWNGNQNYVSGGNIFTLNDAPAASMTSSVTVSSLTATPTAATSDDSQGTQPTCGGGDFLADLLCFLDSLFA